VYHILKVFPDSMRPTKSAAPVKPVYAGKPTKGRIKLLIWGQGTGSISTSSGDVFFHKSEADGRFWDLKVGDPVVFELLEDAISGPRAQNVRTARKAR